MQPIRIEVTDEVNVFNSRDGKRYEKQIAYAWLQNAHGAEDRHPSKIRLSVGRDGALRPGNYHLSSASLRVGKFDALEMGWPILIPAGPVSALASGAGAGAAPANGNATAPTPAPQAAAAARAATR